MFVLVAALSCTLVSGTSFAAYRMTIGPRQCCKSHCGHALPKRAAEQCCRAHPALPGATAKVTAAPDVVAAVVALPAASASLPMFFDASLPRVDRGPPDGRTLLSLHTSLAL